MLANTINKSIAMWITAKFKTFYFLFSFLIFAFWILPFNAAEAALILQAPKYIGLNNGLVGYWSFDGKDMAGNISYDRSGNANNGTLTNGPVRAIGKIGQALSFDGVDDYVSLGTPRIADEIAYTISAWIKTTQTTRGRVYQERGTGIAQISVNENAAGDIEFLSYDGTNANAVNISSAGVNNGSWHHLVGVQRSKSRVELFIDGVSRGTDSSQTVGTVTVTTSNIGRDSTNAYFFNGLVDDVRVYNRALSSDEIRRLYRIGATLKVNTSINNDSLTRGLVGYWSLNAPDIAGTTVYDRSGQGKNGSALGQDISRSGLVGWWKLDGASSGSIANGTTVGFEDFSGSANNGTASNANGTGMAWAAGKIGLGDVSFDGVDDYVRQDAYSSSLDLLGTSLTLSAWVKPNNATNWQMIVNRPRLDTSHGAPYFEWSMHREITTGTLNFLIGCDGANHPSNSAIPNGVWSHVLVTYESNSIKHYINGVLDRTTTGVTCSVVNTNSTRVRIGSNGGSDEVMDGLVDDVRIYSRAISATEATQLYNYGLPKFAPAIGKIGQGIDSTLSYVNPGNVSSSVNSFTFWMKTASSSPTINLLDLNASQNIKIVAGTVTASGLTSPSIFVDGASASTVNAGWHHIAVTTGTAVNASAVNLGLNATTTAPLDGAIDDVRFYNRVINGDEIKRLYRIGATLKVNTDVSRDNPDLERGLVGYWSFDGKDMSNLTALDRSGNSNNGTLTNGPTRTIGKIGQALSFDGVDDWVALGDGTSLEPSNVTVSAWVKRSGIQGAWDRILIKGSSGSAPWGSYQFEFTDDGITPYFNVGFTDNTTAGWNATAMNDGQWYHLVGTYDGTTASFYMNGILTYDDSGGAGKTIKYDATQLTMGGSEGSTLSSVSMDDVRIYNRALSTDEIKRLYNLGR